jgi:signal transduction histidine kinase
MIAPAQLRAVPLFADATDDQIAWLLDRAEEVWFEPGDVVLRQGDPAVHFWVILHGQARFTVERSGQDSMFITHDDGAFFAEVPIMIGTPYLGTGHALRQSHMLRWSADDFWATLRLMPATTRMILEAASQRMFLYQGMLQQQEKLAAIGKLAAGLAHELNNPASAARRAARDLAGTLDRVQTLALTLGALRLDPALLDDLHALRRSAEQQIALPPTLDPLAQADREDVLAAWLDAHGIDGWELAPTLVRAGLDQNAILPIVDRVPHDARDLVVRWLEASLAATILAADIQSGATRVGELVGLIRTYSFMDQAPVQEIDIHDGLETTLRVIDFRLTPGIAIRREYDRDLPRIVAHGSELNQVWTNLIDNALDALGGAGEITIRTAREHDQALITIADTGSGIPPELLSRIWEPFFTTKGVGQGTGLGLDTAYRTIVERHGGDIRVESQPGNTRFEIRLPLQGREKVRR